jgi:hypothetical protein
LAQAREHVATGEKNIARQRQIVAQLERDGHNASAARQSLAQFEELQAMHIADRDRIEKELAENREG